VARRLGLSPEQVYTEGIVRYGNTSAASIPLGYADRRARSSPASGPRLEVDVAFGAGYAAGALLREVP
jgi:3-oxoacyl-[acyl-carrier-protein] synthase III